MFLTAFEDLHRDPQTKKQGENRKELGVEKQLQKLLCTTIIPTRKLSKISVLIHKCGMHNDTVHHKNPKYRKNTEINMIRNEVKHIIIIKSLVKMTGKRQMKSSKDIIWKIH